MSEFKDKDVVRWSYTQEKLKRVDDGNNGGTTYWCVSRIAIYSEARELFVDTYWHSNDNRSFGLGQIGVDIVVNVVGNMNDLEECREEKFGYYDQRDCLDLSHPNATRGGRYIKKGAKRSLVKMRRVVEAHIEHYQRKAEYYASSASKLADDLEGLTEESYLPCDSDVYIPND